MITLLFGIANKKYPINNKLLIIKTLAIVNTYNILLLIDNSCIENITAKNPSENTLPPLPPYTSVLCGIPALTFAFSESLEGVRSFTC